ncbi:MAG: signal recognition particle receptor subunit alpha, partial [Nanoarchaeota archaeon]|nr:signal recognition particle receptor subunit alpha [Nanoarchaeota archaeon]
MFKSLKNKLSGWFKGKEESDEKEVKKKVEKSVKKVEKKKAEKKTVKKKSEKKEVEKDLKKKASEILDEVELSPSLDKQLRGETVGEGIKEKAEDAEKEFEKDEVQIRSEELLEAIKKEEVGRSKEEEPLSKEEVHEEVSEKNGFFGKLAKKLTTSELTEEGFDEFFDEFEFTLLEHNVALGVVDEIRESLKKSLVGKQFGKKEFEGKILGALKNSIEGVLIEPEDLLAKVKEKKDGPFVILFFGINGSGKTTS